MIIFLAYLKKNSLHRKHTNRHQKFLEVKGKSSILASVADPDPEDPGLFEHPDP